MGNRVAQTKGASTTFYALDVALGLPEVIYTSEGHSYLHLSGIIMTENDTGDVRYLLSDGLGSVRHVTDETTKLLAYREYDPYGKPLTTALPTTPYAFTGEWWEADLNLLYLRARWYAPGVGVFLSVDAVESEPAYQYVGGRVVNLTDPSGMNPTSPTPIPNPILDDDCFEQNCKVEVYNAPVHQNNIAGTGLDKYFPDGLPFDHLFLLFTDQNEELHLFEGGPRLREGIEKEVLNGVYNIVSIEELDLVGRRTETPVVMSENKEACKTLNCLKQTLSQIKQANLQYSWTRINSNALVYSLLFHCSLPTQPSPNGVNFGWGVDLIEIITLQQWNDGRYPN